MRREREREAGEGETNNLHFYRYLSDREIGEIGEIGKSEFIDLKFKFLILPQLLHKSVQEYTKN